MTNTRKYQSNLTNQSLPNNTCVCVQNTLAKCFWMHLRLCKLIAHGLRFVNALTNTIKLACECNWNKIMLYMCLVLAVHHCRWVLLTDYFGESLFLYGCALVVWLCDALVDTVSSAFPPASSLGQHPGETNRIWGGYYTCNSDTWSWTM